MLLQLPSFSESIQYCKEHIKNTEKIINNVQYSAHYMPEIKKNELISNIKTIKEMALIRLDGLKKLMEPIKQLYSPKLNNLDLSFLSFNAKYNFGVLERAYYEMAKNIHLETFFIERLDFLLNLLND